MEEFYEAWNYLNNHRIFQVPFGDNVSISHFQKALDIDVVKVNPLNMTKEDDETLNTKVEIWLEAGPAFVEDGKILYQHDIDLDVGGDTFEVAIINLAKEVAKKYD